jgi:hypothetical protein
METQSKNAQIWVRDPTNLHELPFWQLMRTGLILARMDKPGKLLVEVRTLHPTVLTADIDGKQVLKTDPMIGPGRHSLWTPELSFVPAAVSARIDAVPEPSDEVKYLQALGIEPETPANVVMPYIGEPGGVLKLRLSYFRYDNGVPFEFTTDELTFKLNSQEAFLRAVAENAHRIVIDKDPEFDKHGHFCGFGQHFDPQHDHDH